MSAAGTAVLDRPVLSEADPFPGRAAVTDARTPSAGSDSGRTRPGRTRPGRTPSGRTPDGAPRTTSRTSHRVVVALTWLAAAASVVVLFRQVTTVDFAPVLASASWGWVALAAVFFGVSLAGAAIGVVACSPVRVGVARTFVVQIASGFVRLISPSALGGAALNARYLQQAGVSTPVAVASVGTAQVVQLLTTLVLLGVLGPLTGTDAVPPTMRGTGLSVLAGVAIAAALLGAGALALLPKLRGRVTDMLSSLAHQARSARLNPRRAAGRLLLAVAGSFLLTIGLVLSLTASVAAMGGAVDVVPIGMAFLIGSAVGSAVPTPGGIGTVEAALVAALVTSGQSVAVALPAVLLFRAVTVWLPVPAGWVAFRLLRRRGHI